MSWRSVGSRALFCSLVTCGSALAQSAPKSSDGAPALAERKARAASLDQEARAAFARGDFLGAAERFAAANRTLPHPATRYNEAVARQRAGQLAPAANLLEAVVLELPAADERRKDAQLRLRELSSQLARLQLTTSEPASASTASVSERATPWQLYLEPGKYTLRVRFARGVRERKLELHGGESLSLEVEAPPASAAPRPTEPNVASPNSWHKTWGLLAIGGAAALGVTSGVLGYATLRARDDFEQSGYANADLRERAVRLRTLTNVALGVCGVASGIGLYLLLTKPAASTAPRVALQFGSGQATVSGAF
jgi:tetratricopeptide (TPR) repeat protein